MFSARIKYAGRGRPARVVRAGPARIATPSLYFGHVRCFLIQHIDNLYFCDFGLYLDCIEIYLDFN